MTMLNTILTFSIYLAVGITESSSRHSLPEGEALGVGCDLQEDSSQLSTCQHFDAVHFGSSNKSIFVIESKGRLGNHLIGFTLSQALAKVLKVQGLVVGETEKLLSTYFENKFAVPTLESKFCNWQDMRFKPYFGSIDELVTNTQWHHGQLLDLWPNGYKVESRTCCPADELQKFVLDQYWDGAKGQFQFLPKYQEHVKETKARTAKAANLSEQDITFVGIHNRRTDYFDYMKSMFGVTKNPYKKRYFVDAMNYFREEHLNPIFLYVSDDMEWGKKHLKGFDDLYFVGKGAVDDNPEAAGYDLAVLAACNHTIITWGSFSMWAASMSGGSYFTEYGIIIPKHLQQPRKKNRI